MVRIRTVMDFKHLLRDKYDETTDTWEETDKVGANSLKAYLLESNISISDVSGPLNKWQALDSQGWYVNTNTQSPDSIFLNTGRRVWILYSLLDARESDLLVDQWTNATRGLDKCWLSRKYLLYWSDKLGWHQRGVGLKFFDGLTPEEEAGYLSLKIWHGATRSIPSLNEVLSIAKDRFAMHSVRWQKKIEGSIPLTEEWYSDGKITINRAYSADEVLTSISEVALRYEDALFEATTLRDKKMGAFELTFTQNIDLDAFSSTVAKGKGLMNLWLVELESEPDFRRYKGIDLHTWDRIFLDVGQNYAYLTVPGKGCVNAAPRIATLQGEDNAGKTDIYFDGVPLFV